METLTINSGGMTSQQQRREFVTFVKKAGEAAASHVDTAACLVQLRTEKLVATAALKTARAYRMSFFKQAGLEELADKYPLELGYIAVDKGCRERGLSHLVVAAALSHRGNSAVCATSNLANFAMHKVLLSRGFIRAGVPWQSDKPGQYLALFLSTAAR